MAASCLVDSMPILKSSLPTLWSQAIEVVNNRMLVLRSLPHAEAENIATDLVFAVFALGTSLHWAEATKFDDLLLDDARDLLRLWESSSWVLDVLLRAYFQQALIYWEMLHSIVTSSIGHVKLDQRRRKYQRRLFEAMEIRGGDTNDHINRVQLPEAPVAFQGTRPNSWCGLSSEVIDVFGQILALYRAARERKREVNTPTTAADCDAVCDIGIAHELLRELLAMNFDDTVRSDELLGFSLHTDDQKTPLSHLQLIAEAYHLASLLQLYLAFRDLDIEALTNHACFTEGTSVRMRDSAPFETPSRRKTLVILALKLIKILEQIPADSGSRCMQPVLYISAAAALKYDNEPAPINSYQATNMLAQASLDEHGIPNSLQPGGGPSFYRHVSRLDQTLSDDLFSLWNSTPSITQASLEVAKARRFISKRLGQLQQTLPSRPIGVVVDLIKAIWVTYDNESLGLDELHWLDIMIDTGLHTFFR